MSLWRPWVGLAMLVLLAVPTASGSASGGVEDRRFSVQLLSAKSAQALQPGLASVVADFPDARVYQGKGVFVLLVGSWDNRAEAEQARNALRPRFPAAFVRSAVVRAQREAPQAKVLSARSAAQKNVLPNRGIPDSQSAIGEQRPEGRASTTAAERRARPARASPIPTPDEASLWVLLREQRYAELDVEIARLRASHPNWSPPAQLLNLKDEGAAQVRITRALLDKDWQAIVALSQQHPQLLDCSNLAFMWGLAEAFHALGNTAGTLAIYERIIPACPIATERIATLYKAQALLSPEHFDDLLQRESLSGTRNANEQTQLDEITYQHRLRPFFEAAKAKDFGRAVGLVQHFEPMLKTRRDAVTATLVGWAYFGTDQFETAARWFDTALSWESGLDDARYGLALSNFQLNRLNEAETALKKVSPDDPRSRTLRGEILLRQALEAYSSKSYQNSLDYLHQAELVGRSGRDVSMLRAWNYYQMGTVEEAAPLFIAAYRSQPDKESAEGAVLSLSRAKRWEELEALASSMGGPMGDRWKAVISQRYYDRQLFLATDVTAPGNYPQLRNIDTPSMAVGAMLRDKSGERGTSKLRVLKTPFAEGTVGLHGTDELRVQLYRVDLDAGSLPANAMIGSFPAAGSFVTAPTTRLRDGVEPHLSWRREGWLSVYAGLGLTPSNARLGSAPVGNIGFVQQHEHGSWRGELFSRPVRESILSYTGIVDPYTDQDWGRVRKSGVSVSGYTAVGESWGASAGLQVMHLGGKDVAANEGWASNLSLARNLKLPGFAYFSVGPDLSYETYRKNLSHFTFGHGGYFSPERLVSLGVSAHFLTNEARQYIIKGDASVGIYDKSDAASPCFPRGGARLPLNPGCQNGYAAAQSRGVSYSAEFVAVRRVSNHLQVGGGFIIRRNPQYDDKAIMVFFRYVFSARGSVMSSDLPTEVFQSLY